MALTVFCSAGEELLWHYALHRIPRVRNSDMSFDYDSVDEEQEAAASSAGAIVLFDSKSSEDEAVQQELTNLSPIPKASGLEEVAPRSLPAKRAVIVEDESEDDDAQDGHGHEEWFEVNETCMVSGMAGAESGLLAGTIVGRIVSRTTRRVQHYIVQGHDDVTRTVLASRVFAMAADGILLALDDAAVAETQSKVQHPPASDPLDYIDDGGHEDAQTRGEATLNASGLLAQALPGRITHFDVGKMTAHDIWNEILLDRSIHGGMLTRTILIAASTNRQCLPLWPFSTKQEHAVEMKRLQGLEFIQHFSSQQKLDWLRVKVFSTVTGSRNTYARLNVTFNGCTTLSLAAVSGVELTDDLRCRIAHLALFGETVRLLDMIYGSRNSLEKHGYASLKSPKLWDMLAANYVNNALWKPFCPVADRFHACSHLDPSAAPPHPGVHSTVVADIFLEICTDWTRLASRVRSPTGCNATGQQLLEEVWANFIMGHSIILTRKEVSMYVFASWNACKDLPEFINRTLCPTQQLTLGVPITPLKHDSASGTALSETTPSFKGGAGSQLHEPLKIIAGTMKSMQAQIAALQQNLTPAKRSLQSETAHPLADELDPDSDLQAYMNTNNISKWWPQIYARLGITTIKDLQYLGKEQTLKFLAGLPALPLFKMAELAETKAQ